MVFKIVHRGEDRRQRGNIGPINLLSPSGQLEYNRLHTCFYIQTKELIQIYISAVLQCIPHYREEIMKMCTNMNLNDCYIYTQCISIWFLESGT